MSELNLKASEANKQTANNGIDAEPGDILLFTRPSGASRLITWFTKSPFYHVAIYQGGTSVVEARPRGVVRRDLTGPEGDACFVVIPAPEGKGREALTWAEGNLGNGYAVIGVFVLILERIFKHLQINYKAPDKFSCAEFIAEAFEHAGVTLFPDCKPEDLFPADFARLLPPMAKERSLDPVTGTQVTLES